MEQRTPSVFRPTVARYIYETYCPPGGTVWDPCSGYGGRVLGAVAAGIRYIGTDVEAETVEGNQRLASLLGAGGQVTLHQQAAEGFDPGPVDLVFTSPPYFDRERYSTASEQSWRKHSGGIDAWVQGFLRPVIEHAHQFLPAGRHLVLNVADLRQGRKVLPLVDLTVTTAVGAGFTLETTLEMPLAVVNRKAGAFEPVLVFRRG
jgi:DNA modification methylase